MFPSRRSARTRHLEREYPIESLDALIDTVRQLWRPARYREERYAASALTDTSRTRAMRDMALLPLYREMITTGAWWDHVDDVAHRIADLLRQFPAEMRPALLAWSTADDMWLRRSAIISQLGAKADTDTVLLSAVLEPNLADPEFSVRKAIGWALRDYAWTNPAWVRAYAAARPLSALSRREALKNIS